MHEGLIFGILGYWLLLAKTVFMTPSRWTSCALWEIRRAMFDFF